MWILVAEAMGALGLLLFIVWWTLGPTHRRERDALQRAAHEQAVARGPGAARSAAGAATPDPSSAGPARRPDEPA